MSGMQVLVIQNVPAGSISRRLLETPMNEDGSIDRVLTTAHTQEGESLPEAKNRIVREILYPAITNPTQRRLLGKHIRLQPLSQTGNTIPREVKGKV